MKITTATDMIKELQRQVDRYGDGLVVLTNGHEEYSVSNVCEGPTQLLFDEAWKESRFPSRYFHIMCEKFPDFIRRRKPGYDSELEP